MSLLDTIANRVARPAGKALDPTIRDIVHAVLKEHGYASPAEVQALRDEVRDMRQRIDGMAARLAECIKLADAARAEAAARPQPAVTPAAAVGAAHCVVPGCDGSVRSKGFCSPHYQKWRRGTLDGFPNR
ncbi:MAG: hypothetical protein EXR71_18875 [Myxococcales bacterium]|nr:hypothetical protein [Myxococcales bacterium]